MIGQSLGKIPPQAVDVEEAVLGQLLLVRDAYGEIANDLISDAFYKDSHQRIFNAIIALSLRNEPIDIITVIQQLKANEDLDLVGGPMYVSQLTNKVSGIANIKSHVKIILQMYAKREMIRICSESIRFAYEDSSDVFELYEKMDGELSTAKLAITGKTTAMEWNEQLSDTVTVIERLQKSDQKVSGVPTGSQKLDSITGGWQKTDLIILAARPSQGKTTRALNFVKSACMFGNSVNVFSLEMGYRQITRKFLNEESEVYGNKLITGDINDSQLAKIQEAKQKLSTFQIHLNDVGGITPNHIRNTIKQRRKKHSVDLILVDYMQLMKPNESMRNRSRDSEIGSISSALKNIAKEFDVPVIVLSQLSRKCEERPDKRPILSDIRESGNIEQDADLVIGLYRPSYYYTFDKDRDYADEINNGMTEEQYKRISELHILKHRNGQADKFIKESFFGEFSRFVPENPSTTHQKTMMPNLKSFSEIESNEQLDF